MKDKDNRKITQSKKSYNRKKLPTLYDWHHEKAWKLLTKETDNSLHQYDYWEQVPEYVQDIYIDKAIKEKDNGNT